MLGLPAYLTSDEHAIVAAACERLIPADGDFPGAAAAGIADYIDGLLGAFLVDPPRVWAGGPFSGRHGGENGFERFLPLGRMEEWAWRTRIQGWQRQYRDGLAALGVDFASLPPGEQDVRLDSVPEFKALLYQHACEGMYADPVYGGNKDSSVWRAIGFDGDVMPRGWTDDEVTNP